MLQIKNISKQYKTGELVQTALNDVSLNLRDNEFVAILGPSGSGKTTLLNIIGGLDRYDSGDLIIDNVSTKNYKDRNWDTYRNHTIGFVFQSYNLIPHQTVLSNVELALTIGGISKKERRQRALQALDEVGLKDQAHKKPNQMSGGQMQRVAIARALVNNPKIVLADEPTGALDTKTSIQVMNLLKQVAKDRLVVMVTHNPDLATEYANRIIKLQDGSIISDSNPYIVPNIALKKKAEKTKKAHMSIFTALSLSFNNLLTKKGRTILTAFAGSIGIIGIALILSLSQGFQNYIDKIQEDTLSSYPLTITSETADTTSAILSMVSDRRENKVDGENVIERQYLTTMFSAIGTNDLKSFKKYIENNQKEIDTCVSQIRYSYSVVPQIYTIDAADKLAKLNPSSILSSMYSSSSMSMLSNLSAGAGGIFSEMTSDINSIKDQYDMLKGRWPENYDELIIVLSEPNSISDLLIYSLGLRDTSELKTIITDVMTGEDVSVKHEPLKFTYDDLMKIDLRLVKATDTYKYNDKYNIYEDMNEDEKFMKDVYDNSLKLKVVGIVCPKENNASTALTAGVHYTKALTKYVVDEAINTPIVQSQLRNKDIDVFSSKRFDEENDKEEKLDFQDMISVDENMIKEAFKVNISADDFALDSMDTESMAKLVTGASTQLAASLSDPKLVKEGMQIIGGLHQAILGGLMGEYESKNVTLASLSPAITTGLKLGKTLDTYINTIDVDKCKSFLQKMPQMDILLSMMSLTDDDYQTIADNSKIVLRNYYGLINPSEIHNDMVIYTPNMETGVVTYGSKNPTINMEMLMDEKIFIGIDMETLIPKYIVSTTGAGKIGEVIAEITKPLMGLGDIFKQDDLMQIDTDKFAKAFKFNMDQNELSRIMSTMMSGTKEKTYSNNLVSLGYQDEDEPTNMSFYFKDFEAKENFLAILDKYNEGLDDEHKLHYTDITGLLMSSVKTIVDSVTYVLIAFVSISLVVSSIMIAVITLISVMERTKEIGILRAMGASKHNVSSIFNAETFIIGLLSGLIGVGVTLLSIPPINTLIHNVTDNYNINAVLPTKYAIILVLISVFLTIIAGIIPSKKAAKQDPVIALRTE